MSTISALHDESRRAVASAVLKGGCVLIHLPDRAGEACADAIAVFLGGLDDAAGTGAVGAGRPRQQMVSRRSRSARQGRATHKS